MHSRTCFTNCSPHYYQKHHKKIIPLHQKAKAAAYVNYCTHIEISNTIHIYERQLNNQHDRATMNDALFITFKYMSYHHPFLLSEHFVTTIIANKEDKETVH